MIFQFHLRPMDGKGMACDESLNHQLILCISDRSGQGWFELLVGLFMRLAVRVG